MVAGFGTVTVDPGFEDVESSSWCYKYIRDVYERGYMPGGYDLAQFRPNESITRADVASGLFGCAGGYYDADDGTVEVQKHPFADVSPNAWYAAAVDWCYEKGIIGGVDGAFRPDGQPTREELAMHLMRYVKWRDKLDNITVDENVLNSYPDAESVDSWAREAMAWAVGEGLMGGPMLNPHGSMTRAEFAKTLCLVQETPQKTQSKIALHPLALGDRDDERVALVIRVFGAQSVQWQVADTGSDNWQNVEGATCAKLNVDRSTYESGLQKWRCEVTFADGREHSKATDGSIRDFVEPDPTTCQWDLTDGVLTISPKKGLTAILEDSYVKDAPWKADADKIRKIVFKDTVYSSDSLRDMFSGRLYPSLEEIDLSGLDTSACEDMSRMFSGCSKLTSITFGDKWDTSSVRSIYSMFSGCSALERLDLSRWDVSSIASPNSMMSSGLHAVFLGCTALTDLDLSGWTFSDEIDITSMFRDCESLTNVDFTGWESNRIVVMYSTFEGCESLKELNINHWNATSLESAERAFYGCSSLKKLDLSSWNTTNMRRCSLMFAGCSSLEEVDLSLWDTTRAKQGNNLMDRMFEDDFKLTKLTLGEKFSFASTPSGLYSVPFGKCWKAENAGVEIRTTPELVDYHNAHKTKETYVLAAKTVDPGQGGGSIGGGGGGGSVEEPSIDVTDKTGGKVSIGDMGDASSGVTGVVSSVLAQDSTAYRQLTAKLAANESVLGAYRVDMKGSGKVAVTVSVGADFNGKTVKILQKGANGVVLESSVAVVGGSAVVLVDSSSDIVVAAAAEDDKPADKPAFSDTPADAWYVADGSLAYVVEHGLMTGYSDSEFAPDDAFLRGQVVTVLWRIAGQPAASAEPFADVDYDEYYGPAVAWARATGVVGGYGDTNTFGPDDKVTRAQLALMLSNYASVVAKQDVTSDGSALADKADADQVPAWAAGALGWAADSGIVTGRETAEGAYIAPEDNALRCEAAKMIAVFHRDVLDLA